MIQLLAFNNVQVIGRKCILLGDGRAVPSLTGMQELKISLRVPCGIDLSIWSQCHPLACLSAF